MHTWKNNVEKFWELQNRVISRKKKKSIIVHLQNWKRRWFVLYRNELKYFNNKEDKEPIKTINLEDAVSVTRDDTSGKSHCFRCVNIACMVTVHSCMSLKVITEVYIYT